MTLAGAYVIGAVSALFNGSFTAFSKLPVVLRARDERFEKETDELYRSVVFSVYTCLGVFLSSWLVVPFIGTAYRANDAAATPPIVYSGLPAFEFTPYGIAAGALFVLAIGFSFAAIPLVGISVGQGVWSGSSILVSFLWGVLFFGNKVNSLPFTGLALLLLLGGVCGIAFCQQLASRLCGQGQGKGEAAGGGHGGGSSAGSGSQQVAYQDPPGSSGRTEERQRLLGGSAHESGKESGAGVLQGMLCAVTVGLFGGSILVPMQLAPSRYQGLVFVPSLGVGTGVAGPLLGLAFFAKQRVVPKLHLREMLLPAVLSGTVWNMGNIASIFATQLIGYAVAYPLMQCALFFGGLWGIFVFREVTSRAATAIFFASSMLLILGAGLLGAFVGQ